MIQGDPKLILSLLIAPLIYSCGDVKTVSPIRTNIVTTVYASGEIVPENEHWISTEKSGTLLKKCVKEGDTVNTGQVLYVIQDVTGEAKIDAARANYTLSSLNVSANSPVLAGIKLQMIAADTRFANDSANYQRWKNLWEHGIGAKNNLDNAYTQYVISMNEKKIASQRYQSELGKLNVAKKMAQSQLSDTKKEFADGFIVSDQPGIVYETLKEVGENVAMNEKLILVGNCSDRTIKLYIDQQDISRVKLGQKVLVETDQYPDTVFEAKVSFIFPSMNKSDQTFSVEAKFDQRSPYSFIHTPVEANIVVDERDDVLVVPRQVLAGKDSLWVIENEKYRKVFVKTGVASFNYVEIVSGVNETNAVILDWYKLK